jgi:acyl-CoA thioester hydrolase
MSSIKSLLPLVFKFTFEIPVRITDINYGNHVGNDSMLTLAHEARVQFLAKHGYTEMNLEGVSLILTKASLELRRELFYGEPLFASVAAGNFTAKGFDLFYKLEKKKAEGKVELVAALITSMVCYDYANKKIVALPEKAAHQLAS